MGAVADMSAAYRRVGAVLQPVQARRRLLGLEAERRPTDVRAWRAAAATAPQLQEPGGWQGTCAKAAWPMTGGGGARAGFGAGGSGSGWGSLRQGQAPMERAVSPSRFPFGSCQLDCSLHGVSDWGALLDRRHAAARCPHQIRCKTDCDHFSKSWHFRCSTHSQSPPKMAHCAPQLKPVRLPEARKQQPDSEISGAAPASRLAAKERCSAELPLTLAAPIFCYHTRKPVRLRPLLRACRRRCQFAADAASSCRRRRRRAAVSPAFVRPPSLRSV